MKHPTKIKHVLANCECRNEQTAFEALRELSELQEYVRTLEERNRELAGELIELGSRYEEAMRILGKIKEVVLLR